MKGDPACFNIEVEFVFVLERRRVLVRKEQAVDIDAELCRLRGKCERMRRQRVGIARCDEKRRQLPRKFAADGKTRGQLGGIERLRAEIGPHCRPQEIGHGAFTIERFGIVDAAVEHKPAQRRGPRTELPRRQQGNGEAKDSGSNPLYHGERRTGENRK